MKYAPWHFASVSAAARPGYSSGRGGCAAAATTDRPLSGVKITTSQQVWKFGICVEQFTDSIHDRLGAQTQLNLSVVTTMASCLMILTSSENVRTLICFATEDTFKLLGAYKLSIYRHRPQVHSLVTTRGMPKPGSMVRRNTGASWYLGNGAKANLLSSRASTTFSSVIARFCPMQVRGPCPNGEYMCAGLHAAVTPLANRSGQNSSASRPQASLSRCSTNVRDHYRRMDR